MRKTKPYFLIALLAGISGVTMLWPENVKVETSEPTEKTLTNPRRTPLVNSGKLEEIVRQPLEEPIKKTVRTIQKPIRPNPYEAFDNSFNFNRRCLLDVSRLAYQF